MFKIEKNQTINVEALTSLLLKRKITKERFRMPLTLEQTIQALNAALRAEVQYRHQAFKESATLTEYINQVARWLVNQDKFGLLICGTCGNGKSTMMRAIQTLINFCDLKDDYNNALAVRLYDAREIARMRKDSYEAYKQIRNYPMLAIDDLGLEPTEVLDYGNILSPVIDLLSYRYNEQLFTLITTNLKPSEIREKYGDRIADRFNEMMGKIIFSNDSYRGK